MADSLTFTILLKRRSFCVTRAEAQRVVDAMQRRETRIQIEVMGSSAAGSGESIEILLPDIVRIIEHQFLANESLQRWWENSSNVVQLSSYR